MATLLHSLLTKMHLFAISGSANITSVTKAEQQRDTAVRCRRLSTQTDTQNKVRDKQISTIAHARIKTTGSAEKRQCQRENALISAPVRSLDFLLFRWINTSPVFPLLEFPPLSVMERACSRCTSLRNGRRLTIYKLFVVVFFAADAVATTTTAAAATTVGSTRRHLVHVPVAIVLQRVENVLTVGLDQVRPRLPQRVNDVVNETHLTHTIGTLHTDSNNPFNGPLSRMTWYQKKQSLTRTLPLWLLYNIFN